MITDNNKYNSLKMPCGISDIRYHISAYQKHYKSNQWIINDFQINIMIHRRRCDVILKSTLCILKLLHRLRARVYLTCLLVSTGLGFNLRQTTAWHFWPAPLQVSGRDYPTFPLCPLQHPPAHRQGNINNT